MTEVAVATAVAPTTKNTVKVTIYNGSTKVKFSYAQMGEIDSDKARNFIFDTLSKIIDNQNKLKALGIKGNFFGLSEHKENMVDIDVENESGNESFLSGLTFKFSQINKVENRQEAFNIIFETHSFINQNHLMID